MYVVDYLQNSFQNTHDFTYLISRCSKSRGCQLRYETIVHLPVARDAEYHNQLIGMH